MKLFQTFAPPQEGTTSPYVIYVTYPYNIPKGYICIATTPGSIYAPDHPENRNPLKICLRSDLVKAYYG